MAPFITNPYRFAGAGSVGGWKELARTTLGSTSSSITVSSIPDKRYYMVLQNDLASGNVNWNFRVGNGSIDPLSNYSDRHSTNGGSDTISTNANRIGDVLGNQPHDRFGVMYFANLASKEKLMQGHIMDYGATGAGIAPDRLEIVGKWTNTSNVIDTVQLLDDGTDKMGIGSQLVVLGWDPADTHTNNFWEELASVNASGSSTVLSSGTITAKKYLWIQCYSEGTSGDIWTDFNNDNNPNYARRYSIDGGPEQTNGSLTALSNFHNAGRAGQEAFSNWFIINNQSNEKLIICHSIQQNTSGAAFAPNRLEIVGKWANTTNQITEIDFDSKSGNFGSNSILKVWGAD